MRSINYRLCTWGRSVAANGESVIGEEMRCKYTYIDSVPGAGQWLLGP